uniref:coiled-coil domain-containing protein 152 isoform X3 n=1 Tax=Doryrhamphus excisus TaxID=161450 RepID=UPI0025ADC555|nr:coiled-coil domain-containing protein 152 isoform X3 [Doryrhamphus excisus]XP_057920653.1 coiled-coil domain-containing protein 152 isoform X3 [Doryrhamphus excisus]XP_057920655.1 coiled-coil domain-containing protein 152 isoform X3 [Doryrhamphus excisus]
MSKINRVNLDKFVKEFAVVEQNMTELNGRNNLLKTKLDEANKVVKFYENKEKSLTEERDTLLVTVNSLQQTLQQQCSLRVENDSLKKNTADLRKQLERTAEDGEAEIQRLHSEMKAQRQSHKRELESVMERCRKQVEDAHMEAVNRLEAKEAEVKTLLEQKDLDLEVMKKTLKDQERKQQSELLKLQMEFGAKLGRIQNTAQCNQQQQQKHDLDNTAHNFFKRKLHFIQEEKSKQIEALRQRIKELEDNQRVGSLNDNRSKKRRT